MPKKFNTTSNVTLIRLKGTPFKTAAELKTNEDKILHEEWQRIERARVRKQLLMKSENKILLAPFLNGFRAKFVGAGGKPKDLVRVYLSDEEMVHVEIDRDVKSDEIPQALEGLVKPMVDGLMSSYLSALGLRNEVSSENVDWSEITKSKNKASR